MLALILPTDDISFAIVLELRDAVAPSAREDKVLLTYSCMSDFLILVLGASTLDTCRCNGYDTRRIGQGRTPYDSSSEHRDN